MDTERFETRTLPAGTIVTIGGIPVRLTVRTEMESHPRNWARMEKDRPEIFDANDAEFLRRREDRRRYDEAMKSKTLPND